MSYLALMQDYTDPLFVEQERDKIAHEIVRAFTPTLMKMPSDATYCRFLREQGLYVGPYIDTPIDRLEKFARVAENTGNTTGPRMNLTTDGSKSVYVPGMCKHAFNAGAAEINSKLDDWSPEHKRAYQSGAKGLEQAAWSVSEAIANNDLDGALTAVYGREWAEFRLSPDSGIKSTHDKPRDRKHG